LGRIKKLSFKTLQEDVLWEDLLAMWLEAERIEALECGWLYDHFYPIYGESNGSCLEGWTTLSCLAGYTKRLGLGLMVSGNPYRHPALLANMVASFDVFSQGRLILGLGAGWHQAETQAYGIDLPPLRERFDRLEEACEVIHRLLTRKASDFDGKYYQLKNAYCEPKPVQKPRPPMIIGGKGERRTLRIAAQYANDWNFPGGPAEELGHKVKVLHGHCADVGRDPAEILVSTQVRVVKDQMAMREKAKAYLDAGANHICLYFYNLSDPGQIQKAVEAVGDL